MLTDFFNTFQFSSTVDALCMSLVVNQCLVFHFDIFCYEKKLCILHHPFDVTKFIEVFRLMRHVTSAEVDIRLHGAILLYILD